MTTDRKGILTLELHDKLSAELKAVATSVTSLNGTMASLAPNTAKASSGLGSLSGAVAGIGKGLAVFNLAADGLHKLGSAASGLVGPFMGFEHTMSGIMAAGGEAISGFRGQMEALALQIGRDTSLSSVQAAGAMEELVKAGLSAQDVLGGAAVGAVALAEAGGIDLPQAASIASAAMNQFGLDASVVPHIADLLAGAASASATDVSAMGESLKNVGATARTVGLSIEDTTTALAALAKNGITGGEAGSSLNRALLSMANPSREAASLMASLGFSAFDASGKLKPLPVLAGDLQAALKNLNPQAQAQALGTMFGTFGLKAGTALFQQGTDGINKLAASIGQISAADVAKERLNNLQGAITILQGSAETIGVVFGSAFGPILTAAVQSITAGVNGMMPPAQQLAGFLPSAFAKAQATLGPVFTALSGVISAGFQLILTTVGMSGDGISNALRGVFADGGLVASVTATLGQITMAVQGFTAGIQVGVGPALSNVAAVFPMLATPLYNVSLLFSTLGLVATTLGPVLSGLAMIVGGALGLAWQTLGLAMTSVVGLFSFIQQNLLLLSPALLLLGGIILGNVIPAFVAWAAGGIAQASFQLQFFALRLTSEIIPAIVSFAVTGASSMASFAASVASAGASALVSGGRFLIGLLPALASSASAAWAAAPAFIAGLLPALSAAAAAAWASATAFLAGLVPAVLGLIPVVATAGAAVIAAFWPIVAVVGVVAVAAALLKAAWDSNFGGIRDFVGGVVDWLMSKFGWLIDGIGSIVGALAKLPGAAMSAASGVSNAFSMPDPMAGMKANMQRSADQAEMQYLSDGNRIGRAGATGINEGLASVPIETPSMGAALPGGGAGGAGAKDAAAAGGAGAAAQDPVQAAMQQVQSVAGAISSGIDALTKAFTFRMPPPTILDKVFDGLKEIAERGMELASGISLESAQLGQAVAQMLSGFTSALSGMVDLGDKLARFRVPTPESLDQLLLLGLAIADISKKLVDVLSQGALAASLEASSISQKIAESLGAWVETLSAMAEMTGKLARARFDVPMGPVLAFVMGLTTFALDLTTRLQLLHGDYLPLVLADSQAVAEMLGPWVDNLAKLADLTGGLARARMDVDLSGATMMLQGLALAAMDVLVVLQRQLGPALLLALDDTKLIAESMAPWLEMLGGLGDVTTGMARMRPVDIGGASVFLLSLLAMTTRFVSTARNQLGPMLLVALEDSREIADTLKAWMEPLAKIGDVALAFDAVRMLAHTRWDTSMTAVWDFISQLAVMTSRFVVTGKGALSTELLVALETSREIADTLKAWLEPFSKIGDVATAFDVVRMQAQTRWDTSMRDVWDFVSQLAVMTSRFVSTGEAALQTGILSALETSRDIADTLGAWITPLSSLADVAQSIDVVRRMAQTRWDTTFRDVEAMFLQLGMVSAQIVAAVQRSADPAAQLEVSRAVADTFGSWLSILSDLGAATDSIRRTHAIDSGVLASMVTMLATVAGASNDIVQAVQRAADPAAQLAMSRAVAETFGVWITTFASVRDATESLADVTSVPASAITSALSLLVDIAASTAPIVAAVLRHADPGPVLEMSRAVAETYGAWLTTLSAAAAASHALVGIEPVNPGELAIAEGIIAAAMAGLDRMASGLVAMNDLIRENYVAALTAFVDLAGGALDLVRGAADIDLRGVVPIQPADLAVVSATIAASVAALGVLVDRHLPVLNGAAKRMLERASEFIDLAGPAVDLFRSSASLGEDLYGAVAPTPASLQIVRDAIGLVVSLIGGLAIEWASGKERLSETVAQMTGFGDAAKSAVDLVAPTVEAIKALADPDLGRVSASGLSRVRSALVQVVSMIETLSSGYLNAKGLLDEARTGAIAGFSDAASSAIGAVADTVGLLVKLHESQGQLGAFSGTVKTQIRAGIQSMVDLMLDMASGYDMASFESRKAMERAAAFGTSVSDIVGSVASVTDSLVKVFEFAFEKSETGRLTPIVRDFGAHVRTQVSGGITAMVETMSLVMADLGPQALAQARLVAMRVQPVAEAVGGMLEPIERLVKNPFVDSKHRASSVMKNAAQTRIKQLAANVALGIKTMATTLLKAFEGIKVPSGIDAGLQSLITVVVGLMDVIDRSLAMPPIDFSRLDDLVRAAQIVGGIGVGMPGIGGAGAISIGGGGIGIGPGGTATIGGAGVPPLFPPGGIEMPSPGAPVVFSGSVTATGPTYIAQVDAGDFNVDGKAIGKVQNLGATKRARTQGARGPVA